MAIDPQVVQKIKDIYQGLRNSMSLNQLINSRGMSGSLNNPNDTFLKTNPEASIGGVLAEHAAYTNAPKGSALANLVQENPKAFDIDTLELDNLYSNLTRRNLGNNVSDWFNNAKR